MPRRPVAVLLVIAALAAVPIAPWFVPAPLGAQPGASPAATPGAAPKPGVPAIPDTPVGTVLRAWFDAFASADSTRILGFYRQYQPSRIAQGNINYRLGSGGFELLSIERSEPRRVELVVKERNSPQISFAVMQLAPEGPPLIESSTLTPMGPNANPAVLRVDAAARKRVLEGAIAQLDSSYVFPDVAKRMGDSLRAWSARGRYDAFTSSTAFAAKLDQDVRTLSRDKHMGVRFSPRASPLPPATPPVRTPEDIARDRARNDESNCGFVKTEVLEGNVGYVKFNGFADPESCGPTASAAMSFVAGTRALIVDMRENGGGSPAMVAWVSSYLFDRRTHLNSLWERRTDRTEEFWTRDDVPGRKFGGAKPVYVLVSNQTFSAAEEFSYNLKALGRAMIVGETTGGGAHPVWGRRIDAHFTIGVPGARAINPITKTNWEGVGVEPDVKVGAPEALATAQRLIREGRAAQVVRP